MSMWRGLVVLLAPKVGALAPQAAAAASSVGAIKELQLFSAFEPRECVLAKKLLGASLEEEATDSAGSAWAASLARMRRRAFGRDNPPWCEEVDGLETLRGAAGAMREELEARLGEGEWTTASYGKIAPEWQFRPLWRHGAFLDDALRDFPRTCAAIERSRVRLHPWQDLACGFARLPSGAKIRRHCDGGLVSWTAHLGLFVPPNCTLTVGSETRPWVEGEWLGFDASWPHAARNDAARDRYVLMLQPLRSDAPDDQIDAVAHALETNHPPVGTPHAAVWTADGRVHSTWRDYTPRGVTLAPGKLLGATPSRLVTPLLEAHQHWRFRVSSRNKPTPRNAPFDDADRVRAHLNNNNNKIRKPDLLAVDGAGDVDWLGFARHDTVAGRWLAGLEGEDTLAGHVAFLTSPAQAALWLPLAAGTLLDDDGRTTIGFGEARTLSHRKRLVDRIIESVEGTSNSTAALEFERFAQRMSLALGSIATLAVVLAIAILSSFWTI